MQALGDMQRLLEEEHVLQMALLFAEQEKEQQRLHQVSMGNYTTNVSNVTQQFFFSPNGEFKSGLDWDKKMALVFFLRPAHRNRSDTTPQYTKRVSVSWPSGSGIGLLISRFPVRFWVWPHCGL